MNPSPTCSREPRPLNGALPGQEILSQVDTYVRQIYGSLNPREVACLAANQGRQLLGCDQVSVALRRGAAVRVEAVSGASFVDRHSRLAQLMRDLFDSVLHWGEQLVYAGARDESLPPKVLSALDAYLAESNCKLLIVRPLRDERQKQQDACRAALLIESFDPPFGPDKLEGRLQPLAEHAGRALYNALEWERASAGWLTRCWYRLQDWWHGRWSRMLAAVGAALVLVIAALAVIPASLRLEARGQLLPRERHIVYATLHGKVVEMKAQHGNEVEKDQELLLMEDLDSQLKVEQLGLKATYAEQRLAVLNEQLGKVTGAEERNALIKEQINQEYELRKATVERDILLQGSPNPRKAPVVAPIAGKVVTFDAREQLVGKTVKPGDPLLRVASTRGPWEIELYLPEASIAPLREGLRRAPDGVLDVDLLLASHPLQTYKGKLRWHDMGGETVTKDNGVLLPLRVQIADPDLAAELANMPVGVETRAKINCGRRSLGYVWFSDLLEFFYERVLF